LDLRQLLQSIESLRDLPSLISALGHRPVWEPIPARAWNRPGAPALSITAVGQTGKLPWFALETASPGRAAICLARRISRRGRVALVLALDPRSRHLGIAVAFDRSPGLEIDLSSPNREQVASLERLAVSGESGALAYAARAADALSTEPVSRRFFRQFKSMLDRMAESLPAPMPATDRHGLVLIQLTRVLFLYFVQSKGWLGGRERFLAEEVDRCLSQGRRIQRDFLRPLFFGTLNQPRSARGPTAQRFGAIPFLNGGLFEPHQLDRRYRGDIPNPLWRDAFDSLFERFHFTVAEGAEAGSVAPDMLGRVFEGVMSPDDRRASGTFYTPAALVQQLVDAALTVHLAARKRCSEAEARQRLGDRDPVSAQLLRDITVLDPAVGSGAFLLGALERLACLGPESDVAARKRRVLQRSLFGVDKNAAAVRLTELRLWLSVLADDQSGSPQAVHPLPNLDCLIRQGDSLLEAGGLQIHSRGGELEAGLTAELTRLRREAVNAIGRAKRELARRLRHLERRALSSALEIAESRHREFISSCVQQARMTDLFGHKRGLDRALRNFLKEARLGLREVRAARRRLEREGEVLWFHYQSAFADVFARGGFDLVLGNPPWLRSEAIPREMRRTLSGRYHWWRVRGSYGGSPDLSVAFLERAFELTAPGGTVAMLVPAKIATAGYGAAARHGLASSTTLSLLANLTGRPEAAFEATVYPLALVATKSLPPSNHRVWTELSGSAQEGIPQARLGGGGPWILTHGGLAGVLTELQQTHPTFSEALTCHLGVKTGHNRAFLNPPEEIEPELVRWAIRGRDVRAFRCRPKVKLLWTHDCRGEPLGRLPARARAHLAHFEAELRSRRDFSDGPTWTMFRVRAAVARYRVVWADLARRLNAVALITRSDLELIPLNTCYLSQTQSASKARALAGWLNSSWLRVIAGVEAVPASGGFFRFNARAIGRLPLPSGVLNDPGLVQLSHRAESGDPVQGELDSLVASLLGLSRKAQKVLRGAGADSFDHC